MAEKLGWWDVWTVDGVAHEGKELAPLAVGRLEGGNERPALSEASAR